MAKHPARCPRCGGRLEFESAADEKIVCPGCQALLSMPGKFRASDKTDPLLGETVGEFEIVELLGRGGMGAVYKARQTSLDRFVAVKVLPRSVSRDPGFIERFQREARAAAAVIHPNIIQVYAVGQDKGFQFIAMEFVEGESLAGLLKRDGALAPARAVDLLRQVASALADAHARGIVHRDIKPANILLTARGQAKVADFGLAKREGVDISVTATGDSLGTPLYMPPEVCRGEKADARSDLYSLGATFYQALAGRPPFHADTPAAVIIQHVQAEVPPLAQAAPGAPPDLCRLIHRLLRKKPADRFQSADELLEALRPIEARLAAEEATPTVAVPGAAAAVPGHSHILKNVGMSAADRDRATAPLPSRVPGPEGGPPHASPAERLAARSRRRRKLLLLGGIAAAIVLVLVLVVVLASSSSRPQATAPVPPTPGTRNQEPSSVAPTPTTEHPTPPSLPPKTDNRQPKTTPVQPAPIAPKEEAPPKPPPPKSEPAPKPPVPPQPEPPLPPLPPGVKVYTDWPFDAAEAKRRQEETAKALGVQIEQDIDLGKGAKMTFVLIPAGEFLMGSPPATSPEKLVAIYGGDAVEYQAEFPQHPVKVTRPFWIGKYEVTQEQWRAVITDDPSSFKDRPKNPVEQVTWDDCQGFLRQLSVRLGKSCRLPTEAEWEYACRAGSASEFCFGGDPADLVRYAWFEDSSGGSTRGVGEKMPNAWGLHDMQGNVWEWCQDWHAPYEKGAQVDPHGPGSGRRRVLRGSGWPSLPRGLRSAWRDSSEPGNRTDRIGFRATLVPEPAGRQVQPPHRTETPQPAETRAAAYAPESDKVWDLFRQKKYAEAETMLGELAKRPEFKATAPLKADTEAAALLKDFWAAAEKGLGEAKGRFLSVAGTSGTLEEAKDGIIRIHTAQGKTLEKELTGLAAKQALYYFRHSGRVAQPPPAVPGETQPRAAVPQQELMVGVFLLADGAMLDDAGKALAAAGEGPSVALYKERLSALLTAAAEAAAQTAWPRIQDEAKGKLTPALGKRLSDLLADFDKKYAQTKFHAGLGDELVELSSRVEYCVGYTKWPFDEAEAKRRQKVTADALGVKTEQDIDLGKGVKMTFVLIPAGEFLMGSPSSIEKLAATYGGEAKEYEGEFPQHRVKISRPFWIGKCEVTQEQWMAIFPTNPSLNKDKPKNPVENVEWNQAHGFGKALSGKLGKTFRLPTEAEWEYACRAGSATEFYFGNDAAKLAGFGWVGVGSTAPVGMKTPNAWGLYDMAGNAWEWVEDWFGKYESAAQTDPEGAPAGGQRVLRGGSWLHDPRYLRSACRCTREPGFRDHTNGFRVVLAAGLR